MRNAQTKPSAGGTARAAFLLGLACSLGPVTVWSADPLPIESPYRGEIRRDASGKLIVIPHRERTPTAAETPVAGTTLKVGAGREIHTLAAAAAIAKDGDVVEIEAGDYIGDTAVWKQNNVTLRGVGGRARIVANGASAEGKALWVVRGGRITVENVEFTGARTRDRNGAGIRFEKGHLIVRNCRFLDNENGILAGSGDMVLEIEDSEFGHNGSGDGLSHNLYVGAIRKLQVTGSYFHHAKVGHLLKSRAVENHILYNRLTDEGQGRASYELEFPNGGLAFVIGNLIEQEKTTENPVIISYGAEGYAHPVNELYLVNNTLIDNLPQSGFFLTAKPGFQLIKAYNNLLVGRRHLNSEAIDGEFVNNPNIPADTFVLADRHDYRIKRESPLHRTFVLPGSARGVDLSPAREYVHPAGSRPLATTPTLPGAKQTLQPDQR